MQKKFKKIIDQHNGILYKIARSYTTEEADFKDLYQEILIQLWQSFPRFRGDAKISTWIYKVALNTSLRFQKQQKKQIKTNAIQTIDFKIADNSAATFLKNSQKEKQIELLYKCINQLAKDDRAIILLHLDGKKYQEVAEIIGISTSNVGVKILRIKKQLFQLLKEQGYEGI